MKVIMGVLLLQTMIMAISATATDSFGMVPSSHHQKVLSDGRQTMLCFAGSPLHHFARHGSIARICGIPRAGRTRQMFERRNSLHGLVMQQMGRKPGEFDLLSGQDFDLLSFRFGPP